MSTRAANIQSFLRALRTPALRKLWAIVASNDDIVIKAVGPGSAVALSATLRANSIQDLLTIFPQAWLLNSGDLANAVGDGLVVLLEERPSQTLYFRDDFLVDQFTGNLEWSSAGIGAAAVTQAVPSGAVTEGAAGVVAVSCGTTATGAVLYRQGVGSIPLAFGATDLFMRMRMGSTSFVTTEEYNAKFGLGNQGAAANAVITTGVYFDLDITNSLNWRANVIVNSVVVGTVVTDVVASAKWNNFRIQISADGRDCFFFIDDAQVAYIRNDEVMTETGARVGPMVQVLKRTGTSARTIYIDLCEFTKDLAR